MKAVLSAVLACTLGLPLLVEVELASAAAVAGPGPSAAAAASAGTLGTPVKGPAGKKGVDPPGAASTTTSSTRASSSASSTSTFTSTSSISSTSPSTSVRLLTTTNTIEVSSFMTSSSSTFLSSKATSTSLAGAASYSGMDSSISATASPVPNDTSESRRTLIIVLSTVLGFVGILLIAAALFLAYRFGRGRRPFGHRGASPINDDEIESWRGTVIEQKQQPPTADPAMLNRKVDSIALTHSPGWTWTASPTSLRSALSPSTTIPDTPSFLAKAPNSRAGLTDETVPGADPFIPPIKRQSSRLSKAPPGHGRSKSRRSSISAKSVWSYNGGVGPNNTDSKTNDKMPMWFDPEDHAIGKELSRTERTSSSPGTSIFDGVPPGGLSPRPKSQLRPWERDMNIGRAIA